MVDNATLEIVQRHLVVWDYSFLNLNYSIVCYLEHEILGTALHDIVFIRPHTIARYVCSLDFFCSFTIMVEKVSTLQPRQFVRLRLIVADFEVSLDVFPELLGDALVDTRGRVNAVPEDLIRYIHWTDFGRWLISVGIRKLRRHRTILFGVDPFSHG